MRAHQGKGLLGLVKAPLARRKNAAVVYPIVFETIEPCTGRISRLDGGEPRSLSASLHRVRLGVDGDSTLGRSRSRGSSRTDPTLGLDLSSRVASASRGREAAGRGRLGGRGTGLTLNGDARGREDDRVPDGES
jgi:hypothetical protein